MIYSSRHILIVAETYTLLTITIPYTEAQSYSSFHRMIAGNHSTFKPTMARLFPSQNVNSSGNVARLLPSHISGMN
ncbi:hypothetical protein MTR_6g014360 [Medicago truncatula]|uniref:Uncharacterized protein n=1 Tax=Medicago truncatula TaxID=3880 RepID=G7KM91_MEDTR|nr:hypothetical protein MTR_6g014360 [Medicago truncatula]